MTFATSLLLVALRRDGSGGHAAYAADDQLGRRGCVVPNPVGRLVARTYRKPSS